MTGDEIITIRGRKVVPGVAEGEALVTTEPISGWGGVDPRNGTVVEMRHELRGQSFAGKVLVFPGAKGSSGWSAQFHVARLMGTAPAAWLSCSGPPRCWPNSSPLPHGRSPAGPFVSWCPWPPGARWMCRPAPSPAT
jgi:hypothetical protein